MGNFVSVDTDDVGKSISMDTDDAGKFIAVDTLLLGNVRSE
jgi:hypothetical protein